MIKCLKYFLCGSLCLLYLFSLNPKALKNNVGEPRFNAPISNTSVQELISDFAENQEELFLTNYSTIYYSNLFKNFSLNTHGTCSFVALSMLLSFYDSYWNDNYIAENFEEVSFYEAPTHLPNSMCNPSFDTESPGVISEAFENVADLTQSEYVSFISNTSGTYFQSYLINLAYSMFDDYCFETNNSYGLTLYEQTQLLSYYLIYCRNITSLEAVICSYSDILTIKEEIIDDIVDGVPLVLNVYSPKFGYHSVIAYDYDDLDDEIYVHAGWKNEDGEVLTHVSLAQLGVTSIESALKIQNNNPYFTNVSDHYHIIDSYTTFDSTSLVYPHNLCCKGGNYSDLIPTFEWESLYQEKWYSDINPYIVLTIYHDSSYPIFSHNISTGNSYTLSETEWNYLCNVDTYDTYYVSVSIKPSYFLQCEEVKLFRKPHGVTISHLILPTDYGYSDAYPTDSTTRDNFITHTTALGYSFETRRYRTGFIHNECIVLSSKKIGINEAFIEYRFNEGIDRSDIQLSYWRETANEEIGLTNGAVKLEARSKGKFIRHLDLLSAKNELSENRNDKSEFTICFEKPVYWIRVSAQTFGVNSNSWNKGRICIGNLEAYTPGILRTNGYELDFNPDYWNNFFQTSTVCYNYALDSTIHFRMTIGESYEGYFDLYDDIEYYVEYDSNHITYFNQLTNEDVVGFVFIPLEDEYEVCPEGTYRVALFVDPILLDYHWYRQNSDGTWSHKPSLNTVRNVDSNNNVIFNPLSCSRQESPFNYSDFVGFYAVTPLRPRFANEEWMEVNINANF